MAKRSAASNSQPAKAGSLFVLPERKISTKFTLKVSRVRITSRNCRLMDKCLSERCRGGGRAYFYDARWRTEADQRNLRSRFTQLVTIGRLWYCGRSLRDCG